MRAIYKFCKIELVRCTVCAGAAGRGQVADARLRAGAVGLPSRLGFRRVRSGGIGVSPVYFLHVCLLIYVRGFARA